MPPPGLAWWSRAVERSPIELRIENRVEDPVVEQDEAALGLRRKSADEAEGRLTRLPHAVAGDHASGNVEGENDVEILDGPGARDVILEDAMLILLDDDLRLRLEIDDCGALDGNAEADLDEEAGVAFFVLIEQRDVAVGVELDKVRRRLRQERRREKTQSGGDARSMGS